MKTVSLRMLFLILTISAFASCGGKTESSPPSAVPPTQAAVTLSSVLTGTMPPDTIIAGYDVTVTLPPGVTIKTVPSGTGDIQPIDSSAITDAPPDAFVYGFYTAATSTTPGTTRIVAISLNANGFAIGNFAVVNGVISAGYWPQTADFSSSAYSTVGIDTSGADASVDLTSQVNITALAVLH